MKELPEWPDGTVAVLSTGAGAPHAIPVSTAVRRGPRTIVLALSLRRESLARLREDIEKQQKKLTLLEERVHLTIAEIKEINREVAVGEAKARRAK